MRESHPRNSIHFTLIYENKTKRRIDLCDVNTPAEKEEKSTSVATDGVLHNCEQ